MAPERPIRRPIRPLPAEVVDRIAAGEVVARPASVVKELVENSLDGGATRVALEIEEGGTKLVRVVDDGVGIPPDELPLAFEQHATSKVRDDRELEGVATLGFRGEALASIGSVSQCRIVSRVDGGEAFAIESTGGRVGDVRPAAGNLGTTVEVRDLFFNTPARRKFLRAASVESGQVTEVFQKLALPRGDVAFSYTRDGKLVSDWPATGDPWSRLALAWPSDVRERAIRVDVRDGDWRVWGLVALPEHAATTARLHHLYVNHRAISDRSVQHAVREAYRGLTEPGRQPAAVLLLELPAGAVDVNVHPTKSEVRFREARRVWSLVNASVREALLADDLVPTARPTPGVPKPPREDVRETLADFFKASLSETQRTFSDLVASPVERPRLADDRLRVPDDRLKVPDDRPRLTDDGLNPSDDRLRVPDDRPRSSDDRPKTPDDRRRVPDDGLNASDDRPRVPDDRPDGRDGGRNTRDDVPVRVMQLHNAYLVVEGPDGMEIIDQHALHERVLYEELLSRVRRGPLESQRLLMPAVADVEESEVAKLDEVGPMLLRLGIEAEAFGPDAIAVHAFPTLLIERRRALDPAEFVAEVLRQTTDAANDEGAIHDVLDLMACKAAVKAGDPLSPAELDHLVKGRHLSPRHTNCPHGRPTTLRLTLDDLERQFKRRGF